MKVAFIVNGKIKHLKKVYTDIIKFEHSQLAERVEVLTSDYHTHAIELAKQASEKNDVLIAVGGDGTINEVLNGILQGNTNCKLANFPFGTANDLSRTTGMSNSIDQLNSLLDKNSFSKIDIGKVKLYTEEAEETERYFINVVDFGIGGYVVEKVAKSRKTFGAKVSFLKAIFESLLTYEQSTIKLKTDNLEWEGKLLSLALSNGKFFGSGIQIASTANMQDGVFNGCIFSDISTKDYLKHIRKIRKGHKINHSGVKYFTTKNMQIEPIELSCAIDIDGEFCGFAPAKVEILPGHIELLMPQPDHLDFC